MTLSKKLILASSSTSRKKLLERLQIPFISAAPNIDENPKSEESPVNLVKRLAIEKAEAITKKYPKAFIIGSDQIGLLDDVLLKKPGNEKTAIKQLTAMQSRRVVFLTSVCVLNAKSGNSLVAVEKSTVYFRHLTTKQISHYVKTEKPFQCVGSFQAEGLGITLFEKITADDPTALIGLPLIRLVQLLERHGINVL